MSKYKLSEEMLETVEKMHFCRFLEFYNKTVFIFEDLLNKIVKDIDSEKGAASQRSHYILRQLSVDIEKLGKILRKKSVKNMKDIKEKK